LFGRIADLKEAIRLAEMDHKFNRAYDLCAQEKGYKNSAHFFQAYLYMAQDDLDFFKEAYDPAHRSHADKKKFLEKISNRKRRPHRSAE
jgi:hypothetical protein